VYLIAALATAALTVAVWQENAGGIFDTYGVLPGFDLSCVAIVNRP
jgi:hypothetical protein